MNIFLLFSHCSKMRLLFIQECLCVSLCASDMACDFVDLEDIPYSSWGDNVFRETFGFHSPALCLTSLQPQGKHNLLPSRECHTFWRTSDIWTILELMRSLPEPHRYLSLILFFDCDKLWSHKCLSARMWNNKKETLNIKGILWPGAWLRFQ